MSDLARELAAFQQFSLSQRVCALKRIIPRSSVKAALRGCGQDRRSCRRLPGWFMVWFIIALGLFASDCYRQIYRWLRPFCQQQSTPPRSTFCQARQRLGCRPLTHLARERIHPLATADTPHAFHQGLRLVAVDGFTVDLPDSPANRKAFGGPRTARAQGAFPQARVLGLVETATHVFLAWQIKHYCRSEVRMLPAVLKFLQAGMLLLWDRNLLKYDPVQQVLQQKAQLLARIKSDLKLVPLQHLPDRSYLARLYRTRDDRRHDRKGILVRVIRYTLDDPRRPGHGQEHRLLTTLLDHRLHPAKTLIELYHMRWEEELAIDELKTHAMQRPVLRSQIPAGVIQEIYGLMLGHYVVRSLMVEAGQRVRISPLRLSFTGTLKILRCRLPEYPRSRAAQKCWWKNLLEEIAQEQIEPRRQRINPRVIKRKMSNWKKKRPEHLHPPQPTKPFRRTIVLLR